MDELETRPLTPETWDAFAALVERHNGIFGGCWCIWFHPDCAERGPGCEPNRALKRSLVEQGRARAAAGPPADVHLHRQALPPFVASPALALRGALDLIAGAGGGVVEGYPQDLSDGRRVGNSFLYNGTRALYEEAGFTDDRPNGKGHTVVRRTVAPT